MRKIPIRRLDTSETYIDVFITVLQTPANGVSTTVQEMREVVPLLDILTSFDQSAVSLEGGELEILLEDAQWSLLCNRLDLYPGFARNGADLLTMIDTVMNAPVVPVVEAASGPEVAEFREG